MYAPLLPLLQAALAGAFSAVMASVWVTFVVTMGTYLEGWKKWLTIATVSILIGLAVMGVCSMPGVGPPR